MSKLEPAHDEHSTFAEQWLTHKISLRIILHIIRESHTDTVSAEEFNMMLDALGLEPSSQLLRSACKVFGFKSIDSVRVPISKIMEWWDATYASGRLHSYAVILDPRLSEIIKITRELSRFKSVGLIAPDFALQLR